MATITTAYDISDTVYIVYPDYATVETMHQFTEYKIFSCIVEEIEIYVQNGVTIIYYHLINNNMHYRNVRLLENDIFATKDEAKTYLLNKLSSVDTTAQNYINNL